MRVRSQSGVFYGDWNLQPIVSIPACDHTVATNTRHKNIFALERPQFHLLSDNNSTKRFNMRPHILAAGVRHKVQTIRPRRLTATGEGTHLLCGSPPEDRNEVPRADRHWSAKSDQIRLREAVRPRDETQTPRRALVDDRRTCRRTASERDRATLTIDK
jgi:hypothetical protein